MRYRKYWQVLFFVLLALYPVLGSMDNLGTFPDYSIEGYDADMQILDLIQNGLSESVWDWIVPMFRLTNGQCHASGVSLPFNLYLIPYFKLMGVSVKALIYASIGCHFLFAIALWFMARVCFPGKNPVFFAAVCFLSPWYQASIFTFSYVFFSMFVSLVALTLFWKALTSDKISLFILAGLAMSVNLYSYTPYRMFSLIALVFWVPFLARAILDKRQLKRKLSYLAVFTVSFLVPLWSNLLHPMETLLAMFYTQESLFGFLYDMDVKSKGAFGFPLYNFPYFLSQLSHSTFRFQMPVLDLAVLFLFTLGMIGSTIKKNEAGQLFAVCGLGLYLALGLFSHFFTMIRVSTVAMPVLIVAGLGLCFLADQVSRLIRPQWGKRLVSLVLLTGFAMLTWSSNQYFHTMFAKPSPVMEMARQIAGREKPVRVVLSSGDDVHEHHRNYIIGLELVGSGKIQRTEDLYIPLSPNQQVFDDAFRNWPEETLLVVTHTDMEPILPTVPIRVWKRFGARFTVYEYAGELSPQASHPRLLPPCNGPGRGNWVERRLRTESAVYSQ